MVWDGVVLSDMILYGITLFCDVIVVGDSVKGNFVWVRCYGVCF